MRSRSLRFLMSTQGVILLTAILLVTGLTILNPVLLSPANLIDLCHNALVTGILAVGVMLVLASGGIDVSFTAIAAFSSTRPSSSLLQAAPPRRLASFSSLAL